MSNSALVGFAQRLSSDSQLLGEVAAIRSRDAARAKSELIRIAAGAGFELTPTEAELIARELPDNELTDTELDAVTGGTGTEQELKLQMYMERRQKCLETIANVAKKTSDTQQQIIGNMK